MGIFALGCLRDKFATNVKVAGCGGATNVDESWIVDKMSRRAISPHPTSSTSLFDESSYAACLDVTPLVVYAIRHCGSNRDAFRRILDQRVRFSREMSFMWDDPPRRLRYTLDNRSPRAKRQTQLRRIVNDCTFVGSMQRTRPTRGDRSLRIVDVVDDARDILTTRTFGIAISPNLVEFDYDEGEGEIKAMKWLARQVDVATRVLMARDNDVFVYSLAHNMRPGTKPILIFHEKSGELLDCWTTMTRERGDRCWLLVFWLSMCLGNDFAHGFVDKSVCSTGRYLDRMLVFFRDEAMSAEADQRDIRGGAARRDRRLRRRSALVQRR